MNDAVCDSSSPALTGGQSAHTEEFAPLVEDGFGSAWSCHNDERVSRPCGLQVVRPGKVQCWCDEEKEDGSCLHPTSQHSSEGSFCRSGCGRELCGACMGNGVGISTDDPSGYGTCSDCNGSGFPPAQDSASRETTDD